MAGTFLGLDANGWLAVVGGAYATATFYLAWATQNASKAAVRTALEVANHQSETAHNIHGGQITAMREVAIIQARASSVSNNRQAWINALRDEVTGFLAEAELRSVVNDEMRLSEEREKEQLKIRRSLTAHIYKVKLLINPTEGESTTLVELLEDADLNGLDGERRERIVAHTQGILKTEWERVKSGD